MTSAWISWALDAWRLWAATAVYLAWIASGRASASFVIILGIVVVISWLIELAFILKASTGNRRAP